MCYLLVKSCIGFGKDMILLTNHGVSSEYFPMLASLPSRHHLHQQELVQNYKDLTSSSFPDPEVSVFKK